MEQNFFIGETDFKVWLPEVQFIQKSDDVYNSRQISGILSSQRRDRQGEDVIAKGLDFSDFLSHGYFNDNHSQETSSVIGYPEEAKYHKDLSQINKNLKGVEGWTYRGYVLKGTRRADDIWELANALQDTPDRRLGFSIEGKVLRRSDKSIKSAKIRNIAITSCPVNVDCKWDVIAKSFHDPEVAKKALSAGFATSPSTQSGGGALRTEDLDSDAKTVSYGRKKKRKEILERALEMDDLCKTMDFVLEKRPDFDEEAAAYLVTHLLKRGK